MNTGGLSKQASCISAAAIGVAFFLPWVSVSFNFPALDQIARWGVSDFVRPFTGGLRGQYSGWDLASGPQMRTPIGTFGSLAATPELWVVLIAAVAAVAFALIFGKQRLAAIGVLAAGGFGLAMLLVSWQRLESGRLPLTAVSPEFGLWLAGAGLVGLIVSGLLALREQAGSPSQAQPSVTAAAS